MSGFIKFLFGEDEPPKQPEADVIMKDRKANVEIRDVFEKSQYKASLMREFIMYRDVIIFFEHQTAKIDKVVGNTLLLMNTSFFLRLNRGGAGFVEYLKKLPDTGFVWRLACSFIQQRYISERLEKINKSVDDLRSKGREVDTELLDELGDLNVKIAKKIQMQNASQFVDVERPLLTFQDFGADRIRAESEYKKIFNMEGVTLEQTIESVTRYPLFKDKSVTWLFENENFKMNTINDFVSA